MSILNLQPLSKETIQKMGMNNHDLWVVKMGDEIHGPFESDSLKQFAAANEDLFNEALASRLENNDFQPFFGHALFQRRSPQVIKAASPDGPFWIMDQGLKVGPLNRLEIEKRIELGTIGLSELVSNNDGATWLKVFEFDGFDRRLHTANELPLSPLDSSFQAAKLALIDRIEAGYNHHAVSDELAEVAHHNLQGARILTLRLDEIPLKTKDDPYISDSLKWAIPTAIAFVMTLVGGAGYILSPDEEAFIAANDIELVPQNIKTQTTQFIKNPNPSSQLEMPIRRPASVPPSAPPPRPKAINTDHYAEESQYPTHIETHSMDENEYGPDPVQESFVESQEPSHVPTEHSLVGRIPAEQADQSLDRSMNGGVDDLPQEQVIEEVSDF